MHRELIRSFLRGTSFMAGALLLAALSVLAAQSMNSFTSGELILASRINTNFQMAAPERAIMAFHLATCPAGWVIADGSNGTPDLRGQFIRGLDTGGGADPDAPRTLNSNQTDSFQGHWHAANASLLIGGQTSSGLNAGVAAGGGYTRVGNLGDGGPGTTANAIQNPITGSNGSPRYANETRPVNVALLYCMRLDT